MSIVLKIFFMITPIIILSGCNQKYIRQDSPIKQEKNYNSCTKHIQIMKYASKYISKEFDEGYFISKDTVGAKAQLFLIENSSPTIFAQNINTALNSYKHQHRLAKKNGCDIKNFQSSPLDKIKNIIQILENEKKAGEK